MYTRMLVAADKGGDLEVFIIMQKAPISWGPILVMENIHTTSTLYACVTEHEAALSLAARQETSNVLTEDNLVSTLHRLGYEIDKAKPLTYRRANLSETEAPKGQDTSPAKEAFISSLDVPSSLNTNTETALKEVFQALKTRQRPPPPGGYPYSKNDHVMTKMGRLPPSPCKCCGSSNHWDKECPDWTVYNARKERGALSVETDTDPETEVLYQSAFSVLVSERIVSEQVSVPGDDQDFELAALRILTPVQERRKTMSTARSVVVEEVEDEHWAQHRVKPKAQNTILEEAEVVDEEVAPVSKKENLRRRPSMEEVEDEHWAEYRSKPKSSKHLIDDDFDLDDDPPNIKASFSIRRDDQFDSNLDEPVPLKPPLEPPPTGTDKPIRLFRRRMRPNGTSAVGVSVLAIRGHVGSLDNAEIDLQLDSCTDITLLSEDFYNSMKNKPALRQGLKLQLWQLTDKDTRIKGYVKLPITMETVNGELLEVEAEAYVVPNMMVPILLGEDFQVNYKVNVTRNVEEGTFISFGSSLYQIKAVVVGRTKDFDRLQKSAHQVGHFIKAKSHRKAKAKRQKQKRKFGVEEKLVCASEDYKIRPHECKNIRVDGNFNEDKEWLVEKNLLANNANDSFFAVPNVLISARHPWVPIANPTDHLRYIRKGEIIGNLTDPNEFFDKPSLPEELEKLRTAASTIKQLIEVQASTASASEEAVEQEDYGPKTAAMPDLTVYPSSKLEELIDVGSLPEHLKEKAWEMLRRRERAFGFDGRLGHLDARVHIRTVDGQVPISVPMYSASPEKRAIIDEQIDKWFEQDVIEPSISPWSAPVIIMY